MAGGFHDEPEVLEVSRVASNNRRRRQSYRSDEPVYIARWWLVYVLGIPMAWFLGASASMQYLYQFESPNDPQNSQQHPTTQSAKAF